jgi:predicted ATPase
VELVGREAECAHIDQLLAAVCGGESSVLKVRGEAGIGKTELLGYAAGQASGFTVLGCSGVETESDSVYAGVYSLVRPILGHLGDARPADPGTDALPVALRAALEKVRGHAA